MIKHIGSSPYFKILMLVWQGEPLAYKLLVTLRSVASTNNFMLGNVDAQGLFKQAFD